MGEVDHNGVEGLCRTRVFGKALSGTPLHLPFKIQKSKFINHQSPGASLAP
jgi:hypothetical protein